MFEDVPKVPGIISLKKTLLFHQDLSRESQEINALNKLGASAQFSGMGTKMDVVLSVVQIL